MIPENLKKLLNKLSPMLGESQLKLIRKEVKKEYKKQGTWDKEHEQELENFIKEIKGK